MLKDINCHVKRCLQTQKGINCDVKRYLQTQVFGVLTLSPVNHCGYITVTVLLLVLSGRISNTKLFKKCYAHVTYPFSLS